MTAAEDDDIDFDRLIRQTPNPGPDRGGGSQILLAGRWCNDAVAAQVVEIEAAIAHHRPRVREVLEACDDGLVNMRAPELRRAVVVVADDLARKRRRERWRRASAVYRERKRLERDAVDPLPPGRRRRRPAYVQPGDTIGTPWHRRAGGRRSAQYDLGNY